MYTDTCAYVRHIHTCVDAGIRDSRIDICALRGYVCVRERGQVELLEEEGIGSYIRRLRRPGSPWCGPV